MRVFKNLHPLFKFTSACLAGLALLFSQAVAADEIRVAVASNFAQTIKALATTFEKQSEHDVVLVFGATGKHYAQIRHGAPFDVFFAADARRPKLLDQNGSAIPGSRFTYAIGKIILWSPDSELVDAEGRVLESDRFRYLAVANPKLAPYGRAAQQILKQRKLWQELNKRMVRGENIGQTFQFVKSGAAELGFVAYSQVKQPGSVATGSYWQPPLELYTPIEQQAVLLKDSRAAREFLNFIKGEQARAIIQDYGYATP